MIGFHSTKEGFKAFSKTDRLIRGGVSIPLRKVSRGMDLTPTPFSTMGFHSTKEGFKGKTESRRGPYPPVSIPLRKVSRPHLLRRKLHGMPVSIPLRKVSRVKGLPLAETVSVRFHSTKEGFKEGARFFAEGSCSEFPFH